VSKKSVELTTRILVRTKYITIKKPIKDKINIRKQDEGIMPNIVHSFDASNISLLIKELIKNNQNINILTIHDCFASNSNDVELMIIHVKVAFSLLYSKTNFIDSYHNFIINYLEKNWIFC
jgi:DNA-directed RNA polymerase